MLINAGEVFYKVPELYIKTMQNIFIYNNGYQRPRPKIVLKFLKFLKIYIFLMLVVLQTFLALPPL